MPGLQENKEGADDVLTPPAVDGVDAAKTAIASTKKEEDVVSIPRSTLEEILATVASLQKTQDAMLKVEDKNKLIAIDRLRNEGRLVKEVKLREVGGLVVVGWKMTKNDVYFLDGRLVEDQEVEVWFEDETKRTIKLREWATLPSYKVYEVIEESKDATGEVYFTVRGEDGKEIKINIKYVN